MSLPPPSYDSFDYPIPDYSFEPRANEERLVYHQQVRQSRGSDTRPTGVFVSQKDGITVVINYQEDKTPTPVFGRKSIIEGTLLVDAPESVSEITVKLMGIIETVSPSTGWLSVNIIDQAHTIYISGDDMPSQSICPSSLPFSCPIPSTFRYDGQEYILPPSYYVLLGGQSQAYYAKCTYQFSAVIIKARPRHTAFLGKNRKHNTFVLEYSPRSRPPQPVIDLSLLTTIKECPEEWRQFSYQIIPKSGKYHLESLTCQFFLPSVGIFGIRDAIPFHVQIVGSDNGSLAKLQSVLRTDKPLFRVHFLRQVAINKNGSKSAVHFPLGEAVLSPTPPVEGALSLPVQGNQEGQKQENMNWEGKIRCELEEKLTPSFNAGIVAITVRQSYSSN
ncbi:hypothetical protein F5876DRAFT_74319 [Lentinula aff. lateritia]|uniref:Uncharacterized protein n=1 Tax=Lentinula aff. lateritia TaxID=2804960 RepID=A0ACC1U8T5_9AGAR|nr:hypothetical protein F5876DRAFT_74319 [Lentinula aff. lateritia]